MCIYMYIDQDWRFQEETRVKTCFWVLVALHVINSQCWHYHLFYLNRNTNIYTCEMSIFLWYNLGSCLQFMLIDSVNLILVSKISLKYRSSGKFRVLTVSVFGNIYFCSTNLTAWIKFTCRAEESCCSKNIRRHRKLVNWLHSSDWWAW